MERVKYHCLVTIDFIEQCDKANLCLKILSQCPAEEFSCFVVWIDLEANCFDSAVAAEMFSKGYCG